MTYYFSKVLHNVSFEEALDKTVNALKKEGFGVISEINFQKTFKEKLNIDFRKYFIVQACSPADAHKSIVAEEKIGLLLPCNFLLQEKNNGIEVSSIDPRIMMKGLENESMAEIALDISQRLERVIKNL